MNLPIGIRPVDPCLRPDLLSESIRNGGSGKWSDLPMPAQPKLSKADSKKLAVWVLGTK